eukprot:6172274-Pleurochrysis_carterae.AAC.1
MQKRIVLISPAMAQGVNANASTRPWRTEACKSQNDFHGLMASETCYQVFAFVSAALWTGPSERESFCAYH